MVLDANDREVIEACQRGDWDAFRLLFEAHQDRVYSIAGKELGLTVPVVGQAQTVAAESDGVLAQARPISQNQRP